jgi:hypothetical protein
MDEKAIDGFVGGLTIEQALSIQKKLNEKKNRPWVI